MYIPTASERKICIYFKIRKHDILKLRFWQRFIPESLHSEEIDLSTKEDSQSTQKKGMHLIQSQENKTGVRWKTRDIWHTWNKAFLFLSCVNIYSRSTGRIYPGRTACYSLAYNTFSLPSPILIQHTRAHIHNTHTHLLNLHYTLSTVVIAQLHKARSLPSRNTQSRWESKKKGIRTTHALP